MSSRYYVEPVSGDSAVLTGSEAHHLAHVMRVRGGEQVTLFDGSGWEFTGEVRRISRHEVELAIVARQQVDRELPLAIHLGAALPKGDRQAWLVEKAVELGVASLTPLRSERSVAQPIDKALARLRRGVIEASKQCGRNRLMQIHEPLPWPEYVHRDIAAPLRLVANPGGQPATAVLAAARSSPSTFREAHLAVGPEGGFTSEEAQLAAAGGWQLVDLGPRILRVETAALWLAGLAQMAVSDGERCGGSGT
jgi:16S rRNA (uracil1498-N3)-methyltransferase